MRRKFLTGAMVLALAVGAFAGCGNREEGGGTPATGNGGGQPANEGPAAPAGAHSQGVTDSTIRIGNAAAVSGALAGVGWPFNQGIEAYLNIVNAEGGVHGRQIEFVHHDDGFDAATGLAFTERLIHDDRVFALVGHFGTPTISATLDMIKDVGIPAVYFASGIAQLYIEDAFSIAQGRGLFPVQPILVAEGRVLVARAIEEYGARNIGIIYTNDEQGHDLLEGARNQVSRMGADFNMVEARITPGGADVSPAVLTMYNEGVDVIIIAAIQHTFPAVVNGIVAAGLDKPVFTTHNNANASEIAAFAADYTGAGATFNVYSTAWLDIFNPNFTPGTDPDEAMFTQDYWTFAAGISALDPDLADNAFAMAGWIAASTFIQGLRNMGNVDFITWDAFMSSMETNPINIPMGGTMSFAGGMRTGTTSLNLLRANVAGEVWENHRPMESLDEVLARVEGR